jgi:hypothetical protein
MNFFFHTQFKLINIYVSNKNSYMVQVLCKKKKKKDIVLIS